MHAAVDKVDSVFRNCSLNCSKNFHCVPSSGSCTPTCDWIEYEEPVNTIINVSVIVSCSVGVMFAILILILAIVKRRKMYVLSIQLYAHHVHRQACMR